MSKTPLLIAAVSLTIASIGCDAYSARFAMNEVFAHKLENNGADLNEALDEAQLLLTAAFGTADDPRLPRVLAENPEFAGLISPDNLKRAAGAVSSDRSGTDFGLYQKHCAQCHGVAGDGAGPTSSFLNPYPRDFRMGVFKFKTTKNGKKPLKSDIIRTLQFGLPGTAMPSFALYGEEDIAALADYVVYLSMRGEVERELYREAEDIGYGSDEVEPFERLITPDLKNSAPDLYRKQLAAFQVTIESAARRWLDASDHIVDVVQPSGQVPIWEDGQLTSDNMKASLSRGKELFEGKVANCSVCHGTAGKGDGEVTDYDDWTKEWTMRNGLDPKDPANRPIINEFIRLGAHKPRNIVPRNFQAGTFRGGSAPEDIYRRIVQGIDGTPMPAVNLVDEASSRGLTSEDVWCIVNYVMSLSTEHSN